MDIEPVDLGDEVRQGFELRLALSPIVLCGPVLGEFPDSRELYALSCVRDRFPFRKLCRDNALAQIDERLIRNLDVEGTDRGGLVAADACAGSKLAAPAAADPARTVRRVADGSISGMITPLGRKNKLCGLLSVAATRRRRVVLPCGWY